MAKLIRLDGGLRLFYKKHASSRAFALGVFVGAGCVYEKRKNNGVAHFIEHMLFKGTETRSSFDIANETDKCGIMLNAFTSRQYTAYYTIGLAEYADKCADILSDLYFNATLTEENIEKEKSVVVEEIKMYEDDSEDVCLENLIRAHYGSKSLAYPILGTEKTVGGLSREDLKAFMGDYYRAENTCVAVVGDVSEAFAVELVKKYFCFSARPDAFRPPSTPAVKPQAAFRKRIKPVEQSAVGLSFPSYPYRHKKRFVPSFLACILGGGMSSRLFQEVREKAGLVYEIYATNNQYVNNGYFVVYFATSPSQVCTALEKVRDCLADAVRTGITEEEYGKAMAQLKTGMALGSESAAEIMRMGGRYGLMNKTVTHESTLKELMKITLDDINAGLRDLIDFRSASLSYVGQELECDLFEILRGDK